MAYSKRNRLKRIIDIQKIYLEKQAVGVTTTKVYELYVAKQYRISSSCYYDYLTVNAKKELKELEQIEEMKKAQLQLF